MGGLFGGGFWGGREGGRGVGMGIVGSVVTAIVLTAAHTCFTLICLPLIIDKLLDDTFLRIALL